MFRIWPTFLLAFLLTNFGSALGAYVLSVQPIAVYDSTWDGTSSGVGFPYLPNKNGPYVPTFESRVDTILGQCMIDVTFLPTVTFDSATYLNSTSTELNVLLRTGSPPPTADPIVENFVNTLSQTAHHMFFVNSHPATPAGPTGSDPMAGSWGQLSAGMSLGAAAAGIAVTPNAGAVAPMRSVMAHSDDINNGTTEAFWTNSVIPTVLAHELSHNLGLDHVSSPTDNLLYVDPAPDPDNPTSTGTQYELSTSQCADVVSTGTANSTLQAVPEPSSFAFVALTLFLTCAMRRYSLRDLGDFA